MWSLDPGVAHLNHGSFGAVPIPVREEQRRWLERWERATTRFILEEFQLAIDGARDQVSRFVGAPAEGFAFVRNATTGVASVLRSMEPSLAEGDEILTTTQAYNAVRQTLEFSARRTGAVVVAVEVPLRVSSSDEVIEAVCAGVGERTRLAVIDHVSSPTGQVFPIQEIVERLEPEIPVLVDGAHGPGQVPLDLHGLGASWYTGNLHKWVCAPKGAGFLVTRQDRLMDTFPVVISHGWNGAEAGAARYRALFDWLGTDDFSPWLATPAAIRLIEAQRPGGWAEVMDANHSLVIEGQRVICEALEVSLPCPASMLGSMAPVELPDFQGQGQDGGLSPLTTELLRAGHEVPVLLWPDSSKQLLRISAHIYNQAEEYDALAKTLVRLVGAT